MLKKYWNYISFLGINMDDESPSDDQMRKIFFNKCMAIGFIGLISQVFYCTLFIGNYGYISVLAAFSAIAGLVIHAKGYYQLAKRVAVYSIFINGIIITALAGGDFLFHLGAITVLIFSWILFDPVKERIELIVFILLSVFIYFIGEFNVFNAPDLSNHADIKIARFVGIIIYTMLVLIFIFFSRSLNLAQSHKLAIALSEKEVLLSDILLKSKALENERNEAEGIILSRTDELRQQKKELEKQNKEKEVLLKEVHHRVKNNLQIIVSLLNLQASKIEDESLVLSLRETQNRIISMSLVHQRIYQNSSFDAIIFKEYIDLLIDNTEAMFSQKMLNVEYANTTDPIIKIDIDIAIPLGLMINEMLTNSFKHAFRSKKQKHNISINLNTLENNKFILRYTDSGPGLPDDFVLEDASTLGIQLIDALSSQIDGELAFYSSNGAIFEVSF